MTISGLGKLRHLETHSRWVQEKVRTGAIEVRKVGGNANFPMHFPSKDKVHQSVNLLGCEYKAGPSAAALPFRPQELGGGNDGQATIGHLPTFTAEEGEAHDLNVLPHHHGDAEIKPFLVIDSPPAVVNVKDWEPTDETTRGGAGGAAACRSRR